MKIGDWKKVSTKVLDKNHKASICVYRFSNDKAFGGTRFKEYKNDSEAMTDCLNLSKAMSYKNRVAGVKAGGGKAVISGKVPLTLPKKQLILKAFSKFLNEFNEDEKKEGIFVTGADVGIYSKDVIFMKKFTPYVHGFAKKDGGIGELGLATAKGIFYGIEYLADKMLHKKLKDCSVGVQGLGQVGFPLVKALLKKGCIVKVSDIDKKKVNKAIKLGAKSCNHPWDEEIFAPCAIGGVLNESLAQSCKAKIICGGANNQLSSKKAGKILFERRIFLLQIML